MEYQEIVTKYNNGNLDTSDLEKKIEVAESLQQRPKLRAEQMTATQFCLNQLANNALVIKEKPDNFSRFKLNCETFLRNSFFELINLIRDSKAWKKMGLIPKEYTLEKFEQIDKKAQFDVLNFLNEKYQQFMEYQKIFDIKNVLEKYDLKQDNQLAKIVFLEKMFEAFNNDYIETEFFALSENEKLLSAIINYKKSKSKKMTLTEFIEDSKRVGIKKDYEKLSKYFSTEDFREIAENLILSQKTLKLSKEAIIDIFREMSEVEKEFSGLRQEQENLRKIKEKYKRFIELKLKLANKKNVIDITNKKSEKIKIPNLNQQSKTQDESENKKEAIIENPDLAKIKINKQVDKLNKNLKIVVLTWFGKKESSLGRIVGVDNINTYLKDMYEEELKTGVKASLFLVTDADRETTSKRILELKKRAKQNGMNDLVEGALGGYGTFVIDSDLNISDGVKMSENTRENIIRLLDCNDGNSSIIDKSEKDYIRYVFYSEEDRNISIDYLQHMKKKFLSIPKVSAQPIVMLIFKEGKRAGIDVLLKNQFLESTKIREYYNSKYVVKSFEKITPKYLISYQKKNFGTDVVEK